jgi:putative addiction module killer protein
MDELFNIKEFVDQDGSSPFRVWVDNLDAQIKARIQARIFRFESGNLGDYKSVGGGVFEARFNFGPGYRLYFGRQESRILLLLLGGDKSKQRRDIKLAKIFWKQYLEEN